LLFLIILELEKNLVRRIIHLLSLGNVNLNHGFNFSFIPYFFN